MNPQGDYFLEGKPMKQKSFKRICALLVAVLMLMSLAPMAGAYYYIDQTVITGGGEGHIEKIMADIDSRQRFESESQRAQVKRRRPQNGKQRLKSRSIQALHAACRSDAGRRLRACRTPSTAADNGRRNHSMGFEEKLMRLLALAWRA